MTIPLGRPLPDASRDLPGRRRRKRASPAPVPKDRSAGRPYAILLPVGFAMPLPSPAARCGVRTFLSGPKLAQALLKNLTRPRRVPGQGFPVSSRPEKILQGRYVRAIAINPALGRGHPLFYGCAPGRVVRQANGNCDIVIDRIGYRLRNAHPPEDRRGMSAPHKRA